MHLKQLQKCSDGIQSAEQALLTSFNEGAEKIVSVNEFAATALTLGTAAATGLYAGALLSLPVIGATGPEVLAVAAVATGAAFAAAAVGGAAEKAVLALGIGVLEAGYKATLDYQAAGLIARCAGNDPPVQ